jgi:hypothetical protein
VSTEIQESLIEKLKSLISAQVPNEDWRQVPSDGSEQHDHYLYGSSKREP